MRVPWIRTPFLGWVCHCDNKALAAYNMDAERSSDSGRENKNCEDTTTLDVIEKSYDYNSEFNVRAERRSYEHNFREQPQQTLQENLLRSASTLRNLYFLPKVGSIS